MRDCAVDIYMGHIVCRANVIAAGAVAARARASAAIILTYDSGTISGSQGFHRSVNPGKVLEL